MGACISRKSDIKQETNDIYLPVPIKQEKATEELIIKFRQSQNEVNKFYRLSYLSNAFDSNSFDFSDDLCELILSYLSLEDKLKLECVNKQWQRLIYNKIIEFEYPLNSNYFSNDFNLNKKLWISRQLLKKCQLIQYLKLTPVCNTEVLSLVAKNCLSLKKIELSFNNLKPIHREVLKLFSQNCGQTLESIKINEFNEENCNTGKQ